MAIKHSPTLIRKPLNRIFINYSLPFLYIGSSETELNKANLISASNFPEFEIRNVTEFIFLLVPLSDLPINKGPKSKIYSDVINTLLK